MMSQVCALYRLTILSKTPAIADGLAVCFQLLFILA